MVTAGHDRETLAVVCLYMNHHEPALCQTDIYAGTCFPSCTY